MTITACNSWPSSFDGAGQAHNSTKRFLDADQLAFFQAQVRIFNQAQSQIQAAGKKLRKMIAARTISLVSPTKGCSGGCVTPPPAPKPEVTEKYWP